jgi:hypothetical protein
MRIATMHDRVNQVQRKGNNECDTGHNGESVEVSTTIGTTALVYCLINSILYTGTVLYKGGGVHPNWLDGHQGCSQLFTRVTFFTTSYL